MRLCLIHVVKFKLLMPEWLEKFVAAIWFDTILLFAKGVIDLQLNTNMKFGLRSSTLHLTFRTFLKHQKSDLFVCSNSQVTFWTCSQPNPTCEFNIFATALACVYSTTETTDLLINMLVSIDKLTVLPESSLVVDCRIKILLVIVALDNESNPSSVRHRVH